MALVVIGDTIAEGLSALHRAGYHVALLSHGGAVAWNDWGDIVMEHRAGTWAGALREICEEVCGGN